MRCSYKNCSNAVKPFSDITFFSIPIDKRRPVWIQNSGNKELENLPLKTKRVICEHHFDDKYLRRQFHRTTLRKDAVPLEFFKDQKLDKPLALVEEYFDFVEATDEKRGELNEHQLIDLTAPDSTQSEHEIVRYVNEPNDNSAEEFLLESEINFKESGDPVYLIRNTPEKSNSSRNSVMNIENVEKYVTVSQDLSSASHKDTYHEIPAKILRKSNHLHTNLLYQNNEVVQHANSTPHVTNIGRIIQLDLNEASNEETYFALSLIGTLKRLDPRKRAIAKCNILKYLTELEYGDGN